MHTETLKKIRTSLLVCVLVAAARASFAGPLEDGLDAFDADDYATAMRLLRPFAAQGDGGAQFRVGWMYDEGKGVPLDDTEAVKWYRLAAAQGDKGAQNNLGGMYSDGEGVKQDYAEAAKWYRLAADQGDARAQFQLGRLYDEGHGVPVNDAEAVKWYRLAGAQGNRAAQHNLGMMYSDGEGVKRNYAEAAKWYRLAADQGDAKARELLNKIAKLAAKDTPLPDTPAPAAAPAAGPAKGAQPREFAVKRAAQKGAQGYDEDNALGYAYMNGNGVPQSYAEAVKHFRLAADKGHVDSQEELAALYEDGSGVPKDAVEAAKWYRLAADQGGRLAQRRLGRMYADGRSVPKDIPEAIKWLTLGTSVPGDPLAEDLLAKISRYNERAVTEDLRVAENALARQDYLTVLRSLEGVLSPDNPFASQGVTRAHALDIRGKVRIEYKDYPVAISDLEEAIRLDPNSAEAKKDLAYAVAVVADKNRIAEQERQRALALEASRKASAGPNGGASGNGGYENSGVKGLIDQTNQTLERQRRENCAAAAQGANRDCVR